MFDSDSIFSHLKPSQSINIRMYFVNTKPSSERRIEVSSIDVIIHDEILPLLYEEMWRFN